MASENKFSISRARQYVNEAIVNENEILLDKFILIYKELTKWGSVFNLILVNHGCITVIETVRRHCGFDEMF